MDSMDSIEVSGVTFSCSSICIESWVYSSSDGSGVCCRTGFDFLDFGGSSDGLAGLVFLTFFGMIDSKSSSILGFRGSRG